MKAFEADTHVETIPLFRAEISTMEDPFPFVFKSHADSEESAYRRCEYWARKNGLTPAMRISCEIVSQTVK